MECIPKRTEKRRSFRRDHGRNFVRVSGKRNFCLISCVSPEKKIYERLVLGGLLVSEAIIVLSPYPVRTDQTREASIRQCTISDCPYFPVYRRSIKLRSEALVLYLRSIWLTLKSIHLGIWLDGGFLPRTRWSRSWFTELARLGHNSGSENRHPPTRTTVNFSKNTYFLIRI